MLPPTICTGRVAATVPSTRRQSGVVKTSSVGMLTMHERPQLVAIPPESHRPPSIVPTVRSVPAAGEVHRREAAFREQARPLPKTLDVLGPGALGVRLVQADDRRDRVPEPVDVGRAEEPLGPALAGPGNHAPVHLAAAHELETLRR